MRLLRSAIAAAVVGAVSLSGMVPATAAGESVVIRKVDLSAFPKVTMTALKPPSVSSADAVTIRENGAEVKDVAVTRFADSAEKSSIVLMLDTSEASNDGDAITKVKDAAINMVMTKSANQKYSVVAFNNGARRVVSFTDDTSLLKQGIESLKASGQPRLWDGVRMSSNLLSDEPGTQHNIVLLTSSPDAGSTAKSDDALATLRDSNAALFPVAISQAAGVDGEALKNLTSKTGGRYIETGDPNNATAILAGISRSLDDQAVINYTSTNKDATSFNLEVAVGGGVGIAHANKGALAEGAQVAPVVVPDPLLPSLFSGWVGLAVIGVAALGSAGLLIYGIIEIATNDHHKLSSALRPYSEDSNGERDFSKISDSDIIKKAVASTAKYAEKRGLLAAVEQRLTQADLPLKPAEAIFFTGVAALVAMIIGLFAAGILGFGAAGLVFAYMPIFITNMRAKRRKKKFQSQLPDTLQLLSGSLRAGYSLLQGLDAVSKQCDAPMATELQRAMSEARLGRPPEEALQEVADRMGSDDFTWAVMAIKIQREVGGNLAELLLTVAETMTAREHLRREVKGLTAEGRISAMVLVALPPGIGLIIFALNPAYIQPLISNSMGQLAIVAATVMVGFGYWLMMKLIEIEA